MKKAATSDLVVDTERRCFLCWSHSASQFSPANSSDFIPYSIHSIHHLSRYLKINQRKVFHAEMSISHDLLVKVEKSKLKVPLCETCACLTEHFSELFLQMEKIELEISSSLDAIHRRLDLARAPLIEHPGGTEYNSDGGLISKLEIAKVLRAETMKKCSTKLKTVIPRVKLENLRNQNLHREKLKSKTTNREATNYLPGMGSKSIHMSNNGDLSDAIVKIEDTEFDGMGDEERDGYLDEPDVHSEASLSSKDFILPSTLKSETSYSHYAAHPEGEIKVKSAKPCGIESKDKKRKIFESIQRRRIGQHSKITPAPSKSADLSGKLQERCSVSPQTGKLKCKLCLKEFIQSKHLQVHYNSFHLNIRYKCDLCGKELHF